MLGLSVALLSCSLAQRSLASFLTDTHLPPTVLKWTHHDIAADFPEPQDRRTVRISYYAFLLFAIATLYNMFAVVVATFGVTWLHGPTLFQLMVSFVYFLTSYPGAWILWHMRLYKNTMKDSATGVRASPCWPHQPQPPRSPRPPAHSSSLP